MSEPIRVLHFADVHVGVENYGKTDAATGISSRVLDFLRRMDEMVDYALAEGVDLVVFAGDAFRNSSPSPTYQREFAHRIRDLAALAPVVLLEGNHDIQAQRSKASSIEIYQVLDVPNVILANEIGVQTIDTARGRVVIGTFPYPQRARLVETLIPAEKRLGASLTQIDEFLRHAVADSLQDLAAQADDLAQDAPRLLTGHFSVEGATLGSERSLMLGREMIVPLGLVADPRWDYVALGHIHKHQNLTARHDNAPPVVYSGSLERIDFGEAHEREKGFCWVELARQATRWRFVPVQTRPMIELRLDLREAPNPLREVRQAIGQRDLRQAIVKLILDLRPQNDAALSDAEVREALRRAEAYHVAAIERRVERPERTRLGSSPEGLSDVELLERYLLSANVPAARRAELLSLAQAILTQDAQRL
ncbi:MAG: exonuclease SbcCD subunit D [Anaerolineae bacterium]|nr:exonuclease SbcCD subunit D [Anaerolineae bacterium]MDW8173767.1 exonuclease SbcCD subunit D [Anaerolineae bacterium]